MMQRQASREYIGIAMPQEFAPMGQALTWFVIGCRQWSQKGIRIAIRCPDGGLLLTTQGAIDAEAATQRAAI
jgi:hypothetical protein